MFGLYLDCSGFSVFVHGTEIHWIPVPKWWEHFSVGQTVHIRIIGFNYEQGHTLASLRRVKPELSPYLELFRLPAGTVLTGHVMLVAAEVIVSVSPGCFGKLAEHPLPVLSAGQEVTVVISSLWVDQSRVEFRLAH